MAKLDADQIARFHEQGVLFLEGLMAAGDLEPVKREIDASIDRAAAAMVSAAKIEDACAWAPFDTRLAALAAQAPEAAHIPYRPDFGGPAYFDFLRHDKILDVAESVLGPELCCHPAHRVRAKLPERLAYAGLKRVPWHQDSVYLAPACDEHLIITVWVALTASTRENGCLKVVPGGHAGGIIGHRIDCRFHHPDTPSGAVTRRGFVARSRANPEAELTSFESFKGLRDAVKPPPATWHRWPVSAAPAVMNTADG